jgi:hypothetical protein
MFHASWKHVVISDGDPLGIPNYLFDLATKAAPLSPPDKTGQHGQFRCPMMGLLPF